MFIWLLLIQFKRFRLGFYSLIACSSVSMFLAMSWSLFRLFWDHLPNQCCSLSPRRLLIATRVSCITSNPPWDDEPGLKSLQRCWFTPSLFLCGLSGSRLTYNSLASCTELQYETRWDETRQGEYKDYTLLRPILFCIQRQKLKIQFDCFIKGALTWTSTKIVPEPNCALHAFFPRSFFPHSDSSSPGKIRCHICLV